ncbi:YwmB family TATA-box binding protein [Anaeroselena agilis]|uniref:YwmB family TATA-box binding protein n=1 Tax=Anaeroselena agilis TaxID=3063788 RepID=A0ABU3P420_9FIRM|nr:YwmB family TATA-box binding protein [Selenomonadales bacterium 4137-cl]
MRRSICYALMAGFLFLSLFVWVQAGDAVHATRVGLLSEAMEATGAVTETVAFNAWSELPDAELSDDELKRVVRASMAKLGYAKGQYDLKLTRSERHRLVRAEASGSGRRIAVIAQIVYPVWDRKRPEAYLVVNTESQAAEADISLLRSRVADAGACGGGSARISTCLVGWLDGKLDKEKWPEKLHAAGQVLGATDAELTVQPGYAGMTGFSPELPESIVVGDKRININLAIRYSPYDNRTYVVIASPVITGEY